MSRRLQVTIGVAVNSSPTTLISKDFSVQAGLRRLQKKDFSVLSNIPTPSTSVLRFYGDPGVGNTYVGISNPGGNAAYDARDVLLGKKLGLSRTFNASGTIDWTTCQYHALKGRIPWPDVQGASLISMLTHWAANDVTATAYWDTMVTGINGCVDSTGKKVPVWLSIVHEPGNPSKINTAQLQSDYRLGKRNMYGYLKARCSNLVVTDAAHMMADFDPTQGRDWRVWHVDWKGTSTPFTGGIASGPFNPNPVDFYTGALSKMDAIALDIYNFWGDNKAFSGRVISAYDTFDTKFSLAYSQYEKAYPTVSLRKPIVIAEMGRVAFCGDPAHAAEVFNTANYNKDQLWWKDAMDVMLAHNVVGISYFDSSTTLSSTGLTDVLDPGSADSTPSTWGVKAYKAWLARTTTKSPVY